MPTEHYPNIQEGAITSGAIIEEFVASEPLDMWTGVVLVAPGTNESWPRVEHSDAVDEKVIGVVVGPKRESGKAADAVGESVKVCVLGPCKHLVNGNTTNIAIGELLEASATVGTGQRSSGGGYAKSMAASTEDGDIIPVFVNTSGSV